MTDPYRLTIAIDPGVVVLDRHFPTFAAMVAEAVTFERRPGRSYGFAFCNSDLADVDSDGLTEDEWTVLEVVS